MKVIELFQKYPFDAIAADFAHLFEVNSGQKLSEQTIARWKSLYEQWLSGTNPVSSELHIRIFARWEYCSPCVDMNCCVLTECKSILHPVATHPSRDELFGMEITCEPDVAFQSETELAAGLFYEMTWYPPGEQRNINIRVQ